MIDRLIERLREHGLGDDREDYDLLDAAADALSRLCEAGDALAAAPVPCECSLLDRCSWCAALIAWGRLRV